MIHTLAMGNGNPSNFLINDYSTKRSFDSKGIRQSQTIGENFKKILKSFDIIRPIKWELSFDAEYLTVGNLDFVEKGKTGIKAYKPRPYPLVVKAENRLSNNYYDFNTKAVIVPLVSSTGHNQLIFSKFKNRVENLN